MKIFGIQIVSQRTLNYLDELVSQTGGNGRSSTKFGYVLAVISGVFSATFMTIVGTIACARHTVSGDAAFWTAYWGGCTGLWGIIIGFVAGAKKHQASVAKDIKMANGKPTDPDPEEGK
jgi:hypothetical protein